jgi:hypothetical protein
MIEYATTTGRVEWDEQYNHVIGAPAPIPPDRAEDYPWKMCGSVISELRYCRQTVLWFWVREVPEYQGNI